MLLAYNVYVHQNAFVMKLNYRVLAIMTWNCTMYTWNDWNNLWTWSCLTDNRSAWTTVRRHQALQAQPKKNCYSPGQRARLAAGPQRPHTALRHILPCRHCRARLLRWSDSARAPRARLVPAPCPGRRHGLFLPATASWPVKASASVRCLKLHASNLCK